MKQKFSNLQSDLDVQVNIWFNDEPRGHSFQS